MSADERSQSLLAKPLYQRALISAAGPFANFILAIVIYMALFMLFGRVVIPPVIGAVTPGGAAQAAGIKPGDLIARIDGKRIDDYQELCSRLVAAECRRRLPIVLNRGGQLTLYATPRHTI